MSSKIKFITADITNKCNLHCEMCDIWRESSKLDLDPNIFEKIFDSNYLDEYFKLTLTGGEPFLSNKFIRIIEVIKEKNPESLSTISTNGVLTDKIISFLDDYYDVFPNLTISISFDGVNFHDKQRGESKLKILKTIKLIKEKFPNLILKLKFTITPINYSDIVPTYKFCNDLGVKFKIKLSESAQNYTNKLKSWSPVWSGEMKSSIKKDLMFIHDDIVLKDIKLSEFIIRTISLLDGKTHLKTCLAPFERIFIMPDASVHSCIHMDSLGNLNSSLLDDLYLSDISNTNKNQASTNSCKGCVSFHGGG